MQRGGWGKVSAPSASWESTQKGVKELPTLNKVYLYLSLNTNRKDDIFVYFRGAITT